MLKEFKGRTAVITGAGSGFGREFALIAADRGMNLVLADIQADSLAETETMVTARGAEVLSMKTDVGDAASVEALRDACLERFGAPGLLFNNAGVAVGGLAWENSVSDWEWVLRVNLWGVIHGIRCFVPAMIQAGRPAHVVNTASVAGLLSPPTMAVYNVSKHGVVTLSETLFHDLRMVGAPVGVSVLCPAFVPTGIADSGRNRPENLRSTQAPTASMRAAQASTEKAVRSGKISAADVAAMTYEAIEQDQFYIVTHERIMDSVRLRVADVSERRNPTDPFSMRQDVAPTSGEGDG